MTQLGDENTPIAQVKALEQTPRVARPLQSCNSQMTAYRPSDSPSSNSMGSETIQVIVRVRPRKQDLWRHAGCVDIQAGRAGTVTAGSPPTGYQFDYVAGEDSTQEHIFDIAGERIVENFLSGFNGCIMAYGQTGSGKTYTMTGVPGEMEEESRGIVQRAMEMVFNSLDRRVVSQDEDLVEYKAEVSFLEIYNEKLSDLLNPAVSSKLTICSSGGGFVDGLTAVEVTSATDAMSLLHNGMALRQQAQTGKNDQSSRSHAVFTLRLTLTTPSAKTISKLHLVDLAGSERVAQTGAEGTRLAEAGHINKSLSALGQFVREVIKVQRRQEQGKEGFVPSRGNPLTHLLKDSFGGNAKTAMVANLSPDPDDADHTISTLKFASDVKGIRSNAVLNRKSLANGEAASALVKENERLRQELAAAAVQQEGELPALREELAALREQNERLQLKLAAAMSQQAKELPQLREKLAATREENERLQQELAVALEEQATPTALKEKELPDLLEEVAALRDENDRLHDELADALASRQDAAGLAAQLELPPGAGSSSSSPEERPSSLWEQVAVLREENEGLRQELAAATARKETTAKAGMPLLVAAVTRQEEENEKLRKELAAVATSKQQLATAASRQEEELSSLVMQVTTLREENERLQQELSGSRESSSDPSQTEDKDKMSSLWEQVSSLEGENERLRKELTSAGEARQGLASLATLQDGKLSSLREELSGLREEKKRLQQELAAAVAAQGDLPSLREEVAALLAENERLKEELATAVAQQAENERLQTELVAAAASMQDLQSAASEQNQRLADLLDGMAALREELQASESSKGELDQFVQSLRAQMDRSAEEHQRAMAQAAAEALEADELRGEKERLEAALDASEEACARVAAQRAATHVALAALSLDFRASQSALAAAEIFVTTAYEAEEKAHRMQLKRQAQVVALRAQAEAQAVEAEKLRGENQRLKCELEFTKELQQKAAEAQARQQRASKAQQARSREQQLPHRQQGKGRGIGGEEGPGAVAEGEQGEGEAPMISLPLVQLEAKQREVFELQAELAAAKHKSLEAVFTHRRTLAQQHSLLWEVQWELEVAARELRKTYGQVTPHQGSPGTEGQQGGSPGERRAANLAGLAGRLQAARLSLPVVSGDAAQQLPVAGTPTAGPGLEEGPLGASTPGSPDRAAIACSSASSSPCSSLSTDIEPEVSLSPTWYTATSRPGTANASPHHLFPHPAAGPLAKGAAADSPAAATCKVAAAGAKQLPMLPEGSEGPAAGDTNPPGSLATRALWASSAPASPAADELPISCAAGTKQALAAEGCSGGNEEPAADQLQQMQPRAVVVVTGDDSAAEADGSAYLASLRATRQGEEESAPEVLMPAGQVGGEGRALGEVHKTLCSLAALVDAKLKEVRKQLHSTPAFGQDDDSDDDP